MSYVSCDNSTLLHPTAFPTGSIGSVIAPPIFTGAVASGASLQAFTPVTIPKGRWLVIGSLFPDGSLAGRTLSGDIKIQKDGVILIRTNNPVTPIDGFSIYANVVFESDGTNVLSMLCTFTTNDGTDYRLRGGDLSLVQVIRVA